MHTFSEHINTTITKCNSKLNVLKALAETSWGQDKETLLITYQSICRSILEYATPIWSPQSSDTNWYKIQVPCAPSRVSNRNSVEHCVAERNAIFTAISARFVALILLPLAPNLRLKVSFIAHQHCGILGAIKDYFSHKFHILLTI